VNLMILIEKILNFSLSAENSNHSLFSLESSKEINVILNKTKRHTTQSLNLFMVYIFSLREFCRSKLSTKQLESIKEFTGLFQNFLKFLIVEVHKAISFSFLTTKLFTVEVLNEFLVLSIEK
jgi:hypothetical protein